MRTQACDVVRRRRQDRRRRPARSAAGRGRQAARAQLTSTSRPGIADEQRIRLTGRGHAGERGGPPGDLYVLVRVAEDERFVRDGNDLVTVLDLPAPSAALGTTVTVPTLDGDEELEVAAGHAARHGLHAARRGHAVAAAAAAAATSASWST